MKGRYDYGNKPLPVKVKVLAAMVVLYVVTPLVRVPVNFVARVATYVPLTILDILNPGDPVPAFDKFQEWTGGGPEYETMPRTPLPPRPISPTNTSLAGTESVALVKAPGRSIGLEPPSL